MKGSKNITTTLIGTVSTIFRQANGYNKNNLSRPIF